MKQLKTYSNADVSQLFTIRANETKWGQNISFANSENWEEQIQSEKFDYVILGIAEDIGIRANYGRAGARYTFEKILSSLLSIQSNRYIDTNKILILGQLEFNELYENIERKTISELRESVEQIDKLVFELCYKIFAAGKKLIVVGGGHNNSYPLLMALSKSLGAKVNCLNIDAHSDFRIQEGRHSGNGFRYAKENNYLNRYGIFGLHENYNSENILNEIDQNPDLQYISLEDILIRKRYSIEHSLNSLVNFLIESPCALEFDMDSIQSMTSSAMSDTGFTFNEGRAIIHQAASLLNPPYLHITEASSDLTQNQNELYLLQKSIVYLISDFIKATQVDV